MLTSDMTSEYLESDMDVKFVETKLLDPFGRLRSRTYPVSRFDTLRERGFRVDGSSIGYVDVHKSDMEVRLLDHANMILPQYNTAVFLCELYDDGVPFNSFGRNVLKKTLKKLPYEVRLGVELEFYLTDTDRKPLDDSIYMESAPGDTTEDFKKNFMLLSEKANTNLGVQVVHAEVGPAQGETELSFSDPVNMLDRLTMLKYLLKLYAMKNDIRATTMPKPFYNEAGNGMHCHISFWEEDESLFYGSAEEISDMAKQAATGILHHSPEMAIFTNNTVNSYKRLVPDHEAPIIPVWGYENRTAMVRIPKSNSLTPQNTRLELRHIDAVNEPYLAMAASIEAAKHGVSQGEDGVMECIESNAYCLTQKEIEELNLPKFPADLGEAIGFADKGRTIPSQIHGDIDRFLSGKRKELAEYTRFIGTLQRDPGIRVTEWELDKYFNM